MKRARRRLADVIVSAALLAVPVVFLSANLKNPSKVNGFDRVVLTVSSPVQQGVSWVVDGLASLVHRYVWLVDVQEENDELRRENDRLRSQLADANREARAAQDLGRLLDLRAAVSAPTLAARVVSVSASPFFRVTRIVLDRGEGEVAAGMPVITAEGVVGRIHRVYGRYADVTLAVDPQAAIDVYLPRTGSRGVARGVAADNAYACRIEYLLRSEEVMTDDVVLTSGLGAVFPRDLRVGKVRKIEKSEYGMYQEVELEPAVDFSHLGAVLVILSPPPPADPAAKSRKAPEAAFGVEAVAPTSPRKP